MISRRITRRSFIKGSAALAASISLIPQSVFGANEKLAIACCGCGGKGGSDIMGVSSQDIVALCDVDLARAGGSFRKFPEAKRYRDYRYMLEEMGDKIDAVTVSTPDHMHFPIAMAAMARGKHVFVQKPMARTVWEAREMTRVAQEKGLATMMGNQGHANEGTRLVYEWVRSGAIGKIQEVHFFTNRPIWPQNVPVPTESQPVPDTLDWNVWLGTAPYRPYNAAYCPFKWRGWWDFGCGALGDMGCHIMDSAFFALDLRNPDWIEAESDANDSNATPSWSVVTYHFPARGDFPALTAKWHDGGSKSNCPRPKDLEEGRKTSDNGAVIIGENGSIMTDCYSDSVRIIPEARMKEVGRPPKMLERSQGGHYQEWISMCKGGARVGSNFVDHAGALTEMVVLGNLAVRSRKRIAWDAGKLATDDAAANHYIRQPYRIF